MIAAYVTGLNAFADLVVTDFFREEVVVLTVCSDLADVVDIARILSSLTLTSVLKLSSCC